MYKCEKHGTLLSEWCEQCEKIVSCDCSEKEIIRFKDLCYECKEGERTVTIYLTYCATCGQVFDAHF